MTYLILMDDDGQEKSVEYKTKKEANRKFKQCVRTMFSVKMFKVGARSGELIKQWEM